MWIIKFVNWGIPYYFIEPKSYANNDNPKNYTVRYTPNVNNALIFRDYAQAELIKKGLEADFCLNDFEKAIANFEVLEVDIEIKVKE